MSDNNNKRNNKNINNSNLVTIVRDVKKEEKNKMEQFTIIIKINEITTSITVTITKNENKNCNSLTMYKVLFNLNNSEGDKSGHFR